MIEENKNIRPNKGKRKEIINPQTEGSNAASGSSSFRTEVPDIREFIISDSDSDIGSEYLSDSSDEEWNKKFNELEKLYNQLEELNKAVESGLEKFKQNLLKSGKTYTEKEIEQLRSESNRANKTVQELENGLKGWIRAYDHLQLDKSIALKEWEILFLDYERQIDELEQLRSEKIALRADYNELKAINKNLERDKKTLENKITDLESDKVTLVENWSQELQAAKQKPQILAAVSFLLLVLMVMFLLGRWWVRIWRKNKTENQCES